ncbi:hypothetical protein OHA77_30550 [Streptosporangium sp. NBC_01639]|uniref:hypothetical protein n=1 Tax=unclassified Streptosporangium TaxID=2632669 RepID=UPI002DD9715F|nr:hypothetical protein [Streptosporangium sp. NBC_01756]WSC88332.1 hypothetical protein OIE48_09150 [Streptosporangium sp. NBC_01756]WTD52969.1 hypothetical protein OHA77_30550 [Streptosporangium sp. NBC_01639]
MAGLVSIGMSVAAWLGSESLEHAGRDRADRWGIFIGEWAPTFFAIGVALRIEETHADTQAVSGEMMEETYSEGRMPSRAGV